MYEDKEWQKYFKFETDTDEVRQQLAELGYKKDFTQEIQENIDFPWERQHPKFRERLQRIYEEHGPITVRLKVGDSHTTTDDNTLYLSPIEFNASYYQDSLGNFHQKPLWSTIEHEVTHLDDTEVIEKYNGFVRLSSLASQATMPPVEPVIEYSNPYETDMGSSHNVHSDMRPSYPLLGKDIDDVEFVRDFVIESPAVLTEDISLAMEGLPTRRDYKNAFSAKTASMLQEIRESINTAAKDPFPCHNRHEEHKDIRLGKIQIFTEKVVERLERLYPNPYAIPEHNDDNSPNIPQFSFKKPPQWER